MASKDVLTARRLDEEFKLSEIQLVLEMRLQRLTLERQKIEEEYLELIKKISEFKELEASVG
jgi:DNA gyrase subunit A